MAITVCLAGATGWAGSELARGIADAEDLSLVAAVSRTHAGHTLGEALGDSRLNRPVYATAAEALRHGPDVYFDYTKPDVAKDNIIAAPEQRAHVVVGTSNWPPTSFRTGRSLTTLTTTRWMHRAAPHASWPAVFGTFASHTHCAHRRDHRSAGSAGRHYVVISDSFCATARLRDQR